jgi:ribosomal protein S6--L-glutamate ligase
MRCIGVVTPDLAEDWASRELLEAANRLGIGLAVDPLSFCVNVDRKSSIVIQGKPAEAYDGFILRALNHEGEIDYQYEVFELLAELGWKVINHPRSLSIAESKAQTTFYLRMAGLPVPRTTVTQNLSEALAAVKNYGTSVLKPLYGSHGVGIERVDSQSVNAEMISAFLESYGAVYIQEYVPNDGRDIRAFVVGDEVPAAIYRIAPLGQWKTNVYLGAECQPCELTPKLREICIEAARVIGLDYTGVDIIVGPDGPMILEVNGTPTWQGLLNVTKRNVAEDVVSHLIYLLDTNQPVRQPIDINFLSSTFKVERFAP